MGLMGPIGLMGPMGPIGLIGLIGLMGCSEAEEGVQRTVLEAQYCATAFEEKVPASGARAWEPVTRAWTPPTGYSTYGNFTAMFAEQVDLFYKSIDVFFTQDGVAPMQGTFFYKESSSSWRFDTETDLKSETYYVYGFIPKEVAEGATISSSATANDNSSYSNGAVLTISGLKSVTHSDVSVIVGAKNGSSDENDGGLTRGDFAVAAKETSTSGATGNHIFLLFDHLYAALRFNFRVEYEYAQLRTIKLTKLELTAFESVNTTAKIKAKYNATVTLTKTTGGASPIASVVFTPDASSADVPYEPIYSGDEVELPSGKYPDGHDQAGEDKYTSFMGCFVPGQNTYFQLRTTYNVYDRQGNKIREGCVAENAIDLRSIFSMTATQLEAGHRYNVSITVKPTYLYVLSEPDLDNPTVSIEH